MSVKEDRYSGGSWDDPSVQQEIILPRDVFRSKFTHWFYERIHHRRVIVSIFINISIFIYVFMTNSETGELFGTICGGYCLVWTLGVLIYTSSKYHLRNCFELTGQLALMVGVIRTRPSADQKTWDAVAYSLNKVLYERGLWNTPYCLYSGKQAYGMFKSWLFSHI
ncbi:Cos3p KNAG_0G03450 [Huiozyma naganishii CBS 8797]|uniref:Uncharacterized protein n=1 Tax=Huiozyma naganishii (strain ATCC MYA-139 / BCRC 22969 / CBS 8797 / KCTC 17520 / NBRC 10181 / NCYC 3082 / Yp74L-3) TaxID=1071383 RepID=J7RP22_HUIN7|nr:hypothetical protein KNAG_0G03450 [Kazachstania naganishii CBS 8797]CCK71403.1 hypothetical protein KNAG_0G03450 [Kazachstania naganishii CBS 8797]